MVKADAAERFLAAPLLQDVDPESRRAVLDVLKEHRAGPPRQKEMAYFVTGAFS